MSWSLPSGVRLDALERDMLELMERAGCYSMALGIEFGAQRIMDLTKKRLTLELVREKLKLFEGLDIKLTGFFLLGVPGETLDEMGQTVRFALELPLHRAQFNNFMPLPGSELWRQLVSEGRIKDINWDRFFVHDVAWAGEGIDARDIKRLQRYAYLKFYLRPRIIRGLLGEVRSPRHLRFLLKRFLDAMR
jgi:magnesium-protoporphyrin IX monomethyl ester (oxidative) cyclase